MKEPRHLVVIQCSLPTKEWIHMATCLKYSLLAGVSHDHLKMTTKWPPRLTIFTQSSGKEWSLTLSLVHNLPAREEHVICYTSPYTLSLKCRIIGPCLNQKCNSYYPSRNKDEFLSHDFHGYWPISGSSAPSKESFLQVSLLQFSHHIFHDVFNLEERSRH